MPKRTELTYAEKLAATKMSRHEARRKLHIDYRTWRRLKDGVEVEPALRTPGQHGGTAASDELAERLVESVRQMPHLNTAQRAWESTAAASCRMPSSSTARGPSSRHRRTWTHCQQPQTRSSGRERESRWQSEPGASSPGDPTARPLPACWAAARRRAAPAESPPGGRPMEASDFVRVAVLSARLRRETVGQRHFEWDTPPRGQSPQPVARA